MADEPNLPQPPSDEEIEARFRKVLDDLGKTELDLPSDPRLRDAEQRLQERGTQNPSQFPEVPKLEFDRKNPGRPKVEDNGYRSLGTGITVAYLLVGSMVMGWGIGWAIDHFTGSVFAQPLCALLGCVFGIAGTIWLINRPEPGGKP